MIREEKKMLKITSTEIRITDLRLRAIIGIFDWERKTKQDVIVNISTTVDLFSVFQSDNFEETVDYKSLTKEVIDLVESSKFYLIEKLAYEILSIVLKRERVLQATVSLDKPCALRFADSVSITVSAQR
jgi:FolB domain-containing protein